MQNIILFIPCYNCQNQISRVLAHLKENDNYKYFSEILIIDNRSTDNTVGKSLEVVDLLNLTNVKVYTNSHNVGLGGTHKMAFTYAQKINATHVAVLHGDDQGNINDLIKIIRSNKHNEHDCCLGSRFSTDSQLK
ncbi:glycosyltransferase, partial [Yersinia sp. 1252 StPb PI]|uniref:glycosyltransferase n=1 Tax=Yersinia sp. 1252 StPb PI TaxID=3117404 RepID=UPI003B2886B6